MRARESRLKLCSFVRVRVLWGSCHEDEEDSLRGFGVWEITTVACATSCGISVVAKRSMD